MMDRVVRVTKKESEETYIGIPIAEGPATFRLVLTWPYQEEGRIVEIPVEEIAEVAEVEPGPTRKRPTVSEDSG